MFSILKKIIDTSEKKRFFGNFISLATLQGLNYILPLLTLPYLVRVLGVDKFGALAIATAVVSYFVVLTDYGFNFTATREVSVFRENNEKLNEIFSSVMIIKAILLVLSLAILSLMVFFIEKFKADPLLYYITFGMVLGQILFPVWFFQGMEKMKYITIINIISKTFFTIAVFVFVKKSSDYYLVPLLTSLGAILSGIYSLFLIYNNFNIRFKFQTKKVLFSYVKGGSHLFLTSALINLLTSSGSLILSFVTTNTIVGYYSAMERLFRAVVGLFSPITQALYPISCTKVNKKELAHSYFKKVLIAIGSVAILVGSLVAIYSSEIVNIVYGSRFQSYSYILAVMMIWLFWGVLNNIIGIQYLTAMRKDKFYTFSFFIAGFTTVALNLCLVPYFFINGILFSMIIGEILLTVIMLSLIFRFKL